MLDTERFDLLTPTRHHTLQISADYMLVCSGLDCSRVQKLFLRNYQELLKNSSGTQEFLKNGFRILEKVHGGGVEYY